MQDELDLKEIDAYAKDAIDDLDDSILRVIRGMNSSDLNGNFASQVKQFLRIKTMFPYKGNDLEADAKRVLVRMVEILS